MPPAIKPKPKSKIPPAGVRDLTKRYKVAVLHPKPGSKDSRGGILGRKLTVSAPLDRDGKQTDSYRTERRRMRGPIPGERIVLEAPTEHTVLRRQSGGMQQGIFQRVEITATRERAGEASAKELFMNLGAESRGLGTKRAFHGRKTRQNRRERMREASGDKR